MSACFKNCKLKRYLFLWCYFLSFLKYAQINLVILFLICVPSQSTKHDVALFYVWTGVSGIVEIESFY